MQLSLDRARDILKIKIEPHMPDYLRLLGIQRDTLSAVLSTQARVDESKLRAQNTDKMAELLDTIRSEEAKRLPH